MKRRAPRGARELKRKYAEIINPDDAVVLREGHVN